jgi:ATP-binding protein involved in chromosome partitioning
MTLLTGAMRVPASGPGRPGRRDYEEPGVAVRYKRFERPRPQANVTGQVASQAEPSGHLAGVRHVLAVASGKGGVGKSTLAANLALAFGRRGLRVGLLDADASGGATTSLLGVSQPAGISADGLTPARAAGEIRLVSMDLFLPEASAEPGASPPDALLWHRQREDNALLGFLTETRWGDLDILLIDLPSGRRSLRCLLDVVPGLAGVVLVTLPGGHTHRALHAALAMLRETGTVTMGLVVNMAGLACAGCAEPLPLFAGEGGAAAAVALGVPFLGAVPFDPLLTRAASTGEVYMQAHSEAPAACAVRKIAAALVDQLDWR